jgi:hypothetical protein
MTDIIDSTERDQPFVEFTDRAVKVGVWFGVAALICVPVNLAGLIAELPAKFCFTALASTCVTLFAVAFAAWRQAIVRGESRE